jgi:streptogramin lyase
VTSGDGALDASSETEVGDAGGLDGDQSAPRDEGSVALDGDAISLAFDATDSSGESADAGCAGDADGSCKVPFCGDAVVDRAEECDKGTGNNTGGYNGCNANCTLGPHCGDGVMNGPEACDQGPDNGTFIGECRQDCSGFIDITEFNLNYANSNPFDIITGPDNNLWFTEGAGRVGQMSPRGNLLKYVFPSSGAIGIAVGPDGNIWFSVDNAKIGTVSAGAMMASETSVSAGSLPVEIASGPHGAMWFVEQRRSKIARLTLNSELTEYDGCVSGTCQLNALAFAGNRVWFTDGIQNAIRSMTLTGTDLKDYTPRTPGSFPWGITVGPDGNLWFAELKGNIGYVTPSGSVGPEVVVTSGGAPWFIATGPDGNLWFTENVGNRIGRTTVAGKLKEASIPTLDSRPRGITTGPDGNVWFVEVTGNKVGRVNIKRL